MIGQVGRYSIWEVRPDAVGASVRYGCGLLVAVPFSLEWGYRVIQILLIHVTKGIGTLVGCTCFRLLVDSGMVLGQDLSVGQGIL
jgi:hypothetical protein